MYVNLLRSSHPNKKSSLHAPDVECILVVTLSMLIATVVAFSGSIRGPDIFNVRLSTQTCTPVVYSAHCGYGSFRPRVVAITFRDCQNHHSSISFSLFLDKITFLSLFHHVICQCDHFGMDLPFTRRSNGKYHVFG
jgi:hypothetical protein